MIDHLVLATPHLETAAAEVSDSWGITLTPGGSHVGFGSRNELTGLGDSAYLEVVGPDVMQPEPAMPRPFGIDTLASARLVTWCARPTRPLSEVITEAAAAGISVGHAASMSRRRPDGVLLEWQLTPPHLDDPHHGVLPFLIDWQQSPHPTTSLSHEATLTTLRLTHPQPNLVRTFIDILGGDPRIEVAAGPAAIQAHIHTPNGDVIL
ncbi:MAG: VOC family protein [Actinomycetota bacterium]